MVNPRRVSKSAVSPAAKLVGRIAFAAAITFGSGIVLAQAYPSRPVRIVVPFPPGNPLDAPTRMIAEKLSQMWGQPVIVDNRPGGTLVIGIDVVAKSAPDGYTLLSTTPAVVQGPALVKDVPYDTLRDLAPITKVIDAYNIFAIDGSLQANNLKEFISLAKANPGKFNFGSFGIGTTAHLLIAKLNQDAKVNIVHIPYKGSGAAYQALLTGEVSAALLSLVTIKPQLASGKLKAIGVVGGRRSPAAPEIPTFEEAGVSGFSEVGFWLAFFGRGGTPEPILNKIAADIGEATKDPKIDAYFRNTGSIPVNNTPAEFRGIVAREVAYWIDLVKTTGVNLNQ